MFCSKKPDKKNFELKSLCAKLFQLFSNINVLGHLSQKIRQEKLSKFIKISELYQVFMHNFLCQNDKIFINAFELYQVFMWQNVSVKIGSISFFSSSVNAMLLALILHLFF